MADNSSELYIVRKKAVPEILRKVVEVNKILASGRARTVNEAVDQVGISRSSYYKFKDDIEEFHDSLTGTTVTLFIEINDETGLLSEVLRVFAVCRANILTIHQSIPLNGVAGITVSIQISSATERVETIIARLGETDGVKQVRITGRA
ncbi:MAG: ACT domain-containing protein [Lachnospiraceae bacterium]|nr:ACT domain-containing protein [Lachnospiraceae bacterium]MBQ5360470.1 ACT domain-containing protein [Lachnospiraceae bacterium]